MKTWNVPPYLQNTDKKSHKSTDEKLDSDENDEATDKHQQKPVIDVTTHNESCVPIQPFETLPNLPENIFVGAIHNGETGIFVTSCLNYSNTHLLLGFSDGKVGLWKFKLNSNDDSINNSSISDKDSEIDKLPQTQFCCWLGTHTRCIRAIGANTDHSKISILSEDGYFTILDINKIIQEIDKENQQQQKSATKKNNLLDGTKYQALPGSLAPLISFCCVGERLYIGTSRGHVVAWSWETPQILAYWHGLEKKPCYQILHARGAKEICVGFGNSYRFLNIFDLGDSMQSWKPHHTANSLIHASSSMVQNKVSPSTSSTSTSSESFNAQSSDSQFSLATGHLNKDLRRDDYSAIKRVQSTTDIPDVDLNISISDYKNSAYLVIIGKTYWVKSGFNLRIWKSIKSLPNTALLPEHASSHKDALSTSIVIEKTLKHPILQKKGPINEQHPLEIDPVLAEDENSMIQWDTPFGVSPTILSWSPLIFILDSNHYITLWNSHTQSYISTLDFHKDWNKPSISNLFIFNNTLLVGLSPNGSLYSWKLK